MVESPEPHELPHGIEDYSRSRRERTASSSYPSEGQKSPIHRVASPELPGTLITSDLSKYASADRNISDLRSDSSCSSTRHSSRNEDHQDAVAEAEVAATLWRDERPRVSSRSKSYGQYELVDSCEVLPLESASQQGGSLTSLAAVTPCPKAAPGPKTRKASEVTFEASRPPTRAQGSQLRDRNHADSPDLPREPTNRTKRLGGGKRTASHFSLRSLTDSIAKRPRLGLKKLADTVFQGSKRALKNVRRHWTQPNPTRRSLGTTHGKAGSTKFSRTVKGTAKSAVQYPSAGKGPRNEDWWTEGQRYQAPKWLRFSGKSL